MANYWQLEENTDQWQLEEGTDLWSLEGSFLLSADTSSYSIVGAPSVNSIELNAVSGTYVINGEAGGGTGLTQGGGSVNNHLLAIMGMGG